MLQMAELHHWMRFWHNTEGKNHIEKSFGLVTSLALSSLWHRQRPVVWMRTLIVFHKVPLPVSRVQGSHQQTETPKLCLLFLVRHNLITWECRASLTSPVLCKTGMFGVFPLPVPTHECSIGFWLLDTLTWEILLRGSHDETSSCFGNCKFQCSWGEWISWHGSAGFSCWASNML